LRLDKAEQAAGALQKALTLAPQDASLQFHLGRVFLAQKKIPAALATWQHAVQLDPKFAEAWNHLAYTCAENRLRLPEARGWALRAVKLEPGNGNYRDTLGWVYFQTAQYAPALDALQQALEAFRAHPEQIDPVVYDHLGDVYDKLNRSADALRAWQRALQLNPQDESLRGKIKRHEPAGK
jgi:tetratricopeptide (TPR) repeat protein